MNQFVKASKKKSKARIALDGPSGAGKTYTALIAAQTITSKYGGRIAVIDTERGSASLYSDKFDFDVLELHTFNPQNYIDSIEAAAAAGYTVVVIDSLSHAWEGEGGALEMVDNITAKSQSKNSYFAWRDVTPLHRKFVDAMLQSPCHVIATMRSKTEYVIETNSQGKQVPRKVGMAPIQRQGIEYEFTIVGDLDLEHRIVISKSRCEALADKVENKPGGKFWSVFVDWLDQGVMPDVPPVSPTNNQQPAASDQPPAISDQPPAISDPIPSEEEKYFGKPRASAPSPAANGKHPSQEMWAKYNDVAGEARDLGVVVPVIDEKTITAPQLAELGKKLKAAIASKRKLMETETVNA